MLTANELVFTFSGSYVCANFGENRSRNATVRVRTHAHWLTDANRFYNLSHAIWYSQGCNWGILLGSVLFRHIRILIPVSILTYMYVSYVIMRHPGKFRRNRRIGGVISIFPVSKNGLPPYWNSSSGYYFYLCVVIGMSFRICLPNFDDCVHMSRWV